MELKNLVDLETGNEYSFGGSSGGSSKLKLVASGDIESNEDGNYITNLDVELNPNKIYFLKMFWSIGYAFNLTTSVADNVGYYGVDKNEWYTTAIVCLGTDMLDISGYEGDNAFYKTTIHYGIYELPYEL